ncbi:hypothetical protein LRY65_05155 [Candidatus Woesebacteria bacterium]|nr:hypothetical protein [Candidatus Woesebacteria bacterium]MCD8506826.1 hypothetical protein [Candidatus Woesebacteria bacterium]MCD8527556.1 hypothetical protein [Candidatus Woesebacteria bacterium]MCD8546296.1 hypothetical protein [Candidatus Woesebacteria bacterium]
MRRLSRRAVWASSLALLIVMSYIGTAQAQVLTTMGGSFSQTHTPVAAESRLVAQGRGQDQGAEQRQVRQQQVEDVRQEIQERRAEVRQDVTERRQEAQENRQQVRDTVTQEHAERLEYRFGIYGDRLADIISRLEVKIDEMEAAGFDVSEERSQLSEAEVLLMDAEDSATEAIMKFVSIEPDLYAEQRSMAMEGRDMAQTARRQYAEVRSMLQDIVQSLKMQQLEARNT